MAERELSILVRAKGAIQAARDIGTVDKKVSGLQRSTGVLKTALGTGIGFVGAQIATRAVGGLVSAVKDAAIGMNASLETSTLQFETLMGDADKAKQHVLGLFQFAASTPFETGPIIEASRIMRTFGGGTLDTKNNLTLFGNAAAAASVDINEVAFWSSRLYAALEAGRPFGEASARLGELGIMTPKTRVQLEKMQKEGKKGPAIWKAYQQSLGRFDGAMEKQADSWAGLTSSVKDNIAILGATSLKPIFDTAKAGMKELLGLLSTPEAAKAAQDFATDLAKFINPENLRSVVGLVKDQLPGAIAAFKAVPWGSIADAMKLMGSGAKIAMDAFASAPPWLQTAVLTGWGLNKLTGGALGSIVGELGKGLIKGVLGMQAGVVNIQAGVVNGPGGGGSPVPPVAPVGTGGGLLATAATIGAGTLATLIAAPLGVLLATKLITDRTDPGGVRNDQGRVDTARARGVPEWNIRNGPANPERFPRAGRGGLSPDDRQARNDMARVGLALQRQGERGGRIQTAIEKAQAANERYANSTAPSIKSMDANMARLRMLQETEGSRSAAWQTQLVAAINRLASIQGQPPVVNVTVPVRTVTNNQTRLNRVANRPPGRGPTID